MLTIAGVKRRLWRAVEQTGTALDIPVQRPFGGDGIRRLFIAATDLLLAIDLRV